VTGIAGLVVGAGRDAANCSGATCRRFESEGAADRGSIWRLCSPDSGHVSLAPVRGPRGGHGGTEMAPSTGSSMDPDQSRSCRGPVADAQEACRVRYRAAHRLPMRPQLRESGALPSDFSVEAAVGSGDEGQVFVSRYALAISSTRSVHSRPGVVDRVPSVNWSARLCRRPLAPKRGVSSADLTWVT
jgi:hypothetical protein